LGIASDLHCDKGGEFGTALNLDIFLLVWQKVIAVGRYKAHDWTVKADPDSVFIVDRLRDYLRMHRDEASEPMYLNNCKYGLHGPIEVMSKSAVDAWGSGWESCRAFFRTQCDGHCWWGEDMFVDQCFQKVLKVRRDNDFRLLVEDHCEPPTGWQACSSSTYVVFHPFKTAESYRHCLEQATGKALSKVATSPAATLAVHTTAATVTTTPPLTTAKRTAAATVATTPAPPPASTPGRSPPPPTPPPPPTSPALACHTAVQGEDCYADVVWARAKGIFQHPEWYEGLRPDSTLVEFQKRLHTNQHVRCPMPCA